MTDRLEGGVLELREVENREPTLFGVAIQEGRVAQGRSELFAPNSLQWSSDGIGILAEHRGAEESRAHPVRARDGSITIEARATAPLLDAWRSGRQAMSIEFVAHDEFVTAAGVREIRGAVLLAVALVHDGEYAQARAELRERPADEEYLRWL